MSQRRIQVIIIDFITNTYKSIRYFYHLVLNRIKFGNQYLPYTNQNKKKSIYILANGPSLNSEMQVLQNDTLFLSSDIMVVNFFYKSQYFEQLKPKYYCLADSGFYSTKIEALSEINSLVTWDMKLIIPLEYYSKSKSYITNEFIQIEPLTTLKYEGFERYRFSQYKKGYSVFSFVNVVNMCLMYSLNMGYSYLYLYGVDHSFLQGLFVDDDNRLCVVNEHHYGTRTGIVRRMTSDNKLWHMKDFIYDKYLTFLEYDNIEAYAQYLGAKIINCTEKSMIDSFTRLAQIKKNNS